jgi:hypothetical protein
LSFDASVVRQINNPLSEDKLPGSGAIESLCQDPVTWRLFSFSQAHRNKPWLRLRSASELPDSKEADLIPLFKSVEKRP